tara:strand:- start:421 stop:798 length:378 start_codon:yes stop_codon:yes gene_type:complete
MNKKKSLNSKILSSYYKLCEQIGRFLGYLTSIIINSISKYLLIGIEGINIGNDKYVESILPVYNNCKKIFKNKFVKSNDDLETKLDSVLDNDLSSSISDKNSSKDIYTINDRNDVTDLDSNHKNV